jgi:hypothetical protein
MSKPGAGNVKVPNPHTGDISVDLLQRILRTSGIDRDDWINA